MTSKNLNDQNLMLLSQRYENYELPKDKKYLLKYFKTNVQRQFLKYYFCFGDYKNFCNHTGNPCQERWLVILEKKLVFLERSKEKARKDFDLELIARIESGKYKFKLD